MSCSPLLGPVYSLLYFGSKGGILSYEPCVCHRHLVPLFCMCTDPHRHLCLSRRQTTLYERAGLGTDRHFDTLPIRVFDLSAGEKWAFSFKMPQVWVFRYRSFRRLSSMRHPPQSCLSQLLCHRRAGLETLSAVCAATVRVCFQVYTAGTTQRPMDR